MVFTIVNIGLLKMADDAVTLEQMQAFSEFLKDKNFSKLQKALEKMGITLSKTESEFQSTVDSMKDMQNEIDKLEKQYKESTNAAEKRGIKEAIGLKEREKQEDYNTLANIARGKALLAMTTAVTVGIVNSFAKAAGSALSGGDALSISAGFMESGIDTANSGIQAAAGQAGKFGSTMEGSKGKTAIFGTAVAIGAQAVGVLSGTISELAKQGIGFMLKQTNLMIDSFKEMNSVGAIYTGGMKEMVDVSLSAGMTIDQFTKAVAANRTEFAAAGLSVGEGSKRMAAAMKAGGDSARNGMFALGMTMEDQADATAKTMALMAGPTGRLTSSNAEVSRQTEEYARNLKIVSDITGEDAKAKQDKIRQENDTLFMKQKLNSMDEKQRVNFNNMLSFMNDDQRRALTEQMKYGSVISTDLAAAQAISPGMMKANREFYDAYKDGSASAQKGRDIQINSAEQIKKDAASQTSLAISTGETAEGMSKVLGHYWDTSVEYSQNGARAAEEAAKLSQEHGKAVSAAVGGSSAVDLMAANQDFAKGMQQIAADNLPAFSKALVTTIDDVGKAVKAISGGAASVASHALGMAAGAVIGGAIGTFIEPGGGTMLGAKLGATLGSSFADGGIARGSDSGHPATLHGTELIVPMKGNALDTNSTGYEDLIKTVSANKPATSSAAGSSSSHLNEAKKTNNQLDELTGLSEETAKLLKRLVDLNERILNVNEKTFHAVA